MFYILGAHMEGWAEPRTFISDSKWTHTTLKQMFTSWSEFVRLMIKMNSRDFSTKVYEQNWARPFHDKLDSWGFDTKFWVVVSLRNLRSKWIRATSKQRFTSSAKVACFTIKINLDDFDSKVYKQHGAAHFVNEIVSFD